MLGFAELGKTSAFGVHARAESESEKENHDTRERVVVVESGKVGCPGISSAWAPVRTAELEDHRAPPRVDTAN